MHWPYSMSIILSGFGSLALFYALRFWKKPAKQFVDYVKLVLVLSFSLRALVVLFHWPFRLPLDLISFGAFLLWLFFEGIHYFFPDTDIETGEKKDGKRRYDYPKMVSNFVLVLASMGVILGSLAKLMHWQASNMLLFGGLGLWALWYGISLIKRKQKIATVLFMGALLLIIGVLFKYNHMEHTNKLLLGALTIGVIGFAIDLLSNTKNDSE